MKDGNTEIFQVTLFARRPPKNRVIFGLAGSDKRWTDLQLCTSSSVSPRLKTELETVEHVHSPSFSLVKHLQARISPTTNMCVSLTMRGLV